MSKGPLRAACSRLWLLHELLVGPALLLNQRQVRILVTPLMGALVACPGAHWEAGQRGEAGPGRKGEQRGPSCSRAGCAGILLSTKKPSLSFLRRSRRVTMNSSLHSGMTFLSLVRPVGVKDKITGSRQRLPRTKSLTHDDSPGS